MTRDRLYLLAGLGSAALLAGAFGFQIFGGLPPCELCMTQRYAHGGAILIALAGLILPYRGIGWLGALAMLASAATGIYQWGTQMKWWTGFTECTATQSFGGLSSQDALAKLMSAPIERCNEINFQFLGLTMPAWNAVLSILLIAIWVAAALKKPRPALEFRG
jgi:disulfide bond formation protein DsbB